MIIQAVAAPEAGTKDDTAVVLGPSRQLHLLMLRWRTRLDPAAFPGFSASLRQRTRVSQADIAYRIGVSEKWFGKLERGECGPNWSDAFLLSVAAGLGLSTTERNLLFLLAKKRPAPILACTHEPACPSAEAADRIAARVVTRHPQEGWSLLCNGVVLFDDTGGLPEHPAYRSVGSKRRPAAVPASETPQPRGRL